MAKRGRPRMTEAEKALRAAERAKRRLPPLVWGKADLEAVGIMQTVGQLWRLERAGRFPRRIYIGNRVAWVPEEIIAYVEERKAARDAA